MRLVPDVTEWDLQRKGEWLHKETLAFLDEVFLRTTVPDDVIMLDEAHKHGFSCRETNCEMQFPLHSARVRYVHCNGTFVASTQYSVCVYVCVCLYVSVTIY